MRMKHCWSCKESSVDNDPKSKSQSSHIVSNEQHHSELHPTQNEQKVSKQIERDLVRRTEYKDDRHDNLEDQNYIRHPTNRYICSNTTSNFTKKSGSNMYPNK